MTPLLIEIQENGGLILKGNIFDAIQSNDSKGAKALVEKDPSLLTSRTDIGRSSGFAPLHLAAGLGNVELVTYFINKGAKTDIKDDRGNTPMHTVAMYELTAANEKIIEILLSHGAAINEKNRDGQTPLVLATKFGRAEMAKFLKKKGAK
jgi:ankyrin repeat protein